MRYKKGDQVLIREWDDMEKEFGFARAGGYIPCLYRFTQEMKPLCGTLLKIIKVDVGSKGQPRYFMEGSARMYCFSDDMIAYKLGGDISLDEMEDGMICVLVNGSVIIWRGVGFNALGTKSMYFDDLCSRKDHDLDIVEIYETKGENIEDMLNIKEFGKCVWKRLCKGKLTDLSIDKITSIDGFNRVTGETTFSSRGLRAEWAFIDTAGLPPEEVI